MHHDQFRCLSVDEKLDELHRLVRTLIQGELIIMTTQADIDAKTTALTAKIAALTSVDQGVVTLLGGMSQQVKDLTAQLQAANPTLDLSAFDALGASIDKNAADVAAAIVANTPAAPAPAPAPAPAAP